MYEIMLFNTYQNLDQFFTLNLLLESRAMICSDKLHKSWKVFLKRDEQLYNEEKYRILAVVLIKLRRFSLT